MRPGRAVRQPEHAEACGLRIAILGSGSRGNAVAVSCGDTLLLVDCGFSAREIADRMRGAGLDPSAITAVLLTHEHSDHLRGIDVLLRRHAHAAHVVTTAGTARSLGPALRERTSIIRDGGHLGLGGIEVCAFATSHDAAEPVGFRMAATRGGSGIRSFGLVSDTGVITAQMLEGLADVDVLGIESNHDVEMLTSGPYPYHLKRRILSARGHLSNDDAAELLERVASERLCAVVGLHRSQENNTAAIAHARLTQTLGRLGHECEVRVASQSSTLTVG